MIRFGKLSNYHHYNKYYLSSRFNYSKFITTQCCKCVNCNRELSRGLGMIKCVQCGTFQPAPPTRAEPSCCPDYYRLLIPDSANEAPKFAIDLRQLRAEYLKLQSAVHPDKLGSLGESWSSWINRAHETLKNPLQRAIYLVNLYESRKNSIPKHADRTEIDEESTHEDVHDISLVLEVREALDSAEDSKIISKIKMENDERIADCCRELEKILLADADELEMAKKCINKLRYWMSIDREIKEK